MKKTWILAHLTFFALCASACDPKEGDQVADDDQTADTEDESEDNPEGETEDEPADEPDDTDDSASSTGGEDDPPEDTDDCSFLCDDSSDSGIAAECSLWDQDCMDGEKCMPWANDGGSSWNASKCTPLEAEADQPGDPCTVEGSGVSGVDSCAVGSMCWNVGEEGTGTCVALCGGSQEAPLCDDPTATCIIANEGFLPLCLPLCDPLLQNCSEGSACYPGDEGFVCVPDASGPDLGAYGDPCEYTNACDPSLLCIGAAAVPGCESARCCSNFCDLGEPEPSAGCGGVAQGQECISAFPEGQVQPGFEDVGFCAIPE